MKNLSLFASALAVLGLTACEKTLVDDIEDVGNGQVKNSVLQVRTRAGGSADEATVADSGQQVALLRIRQQYRLPIEQTLEDVAYHILAILLVVQQGACHPLHLGIVLLEQPLNRLSFHRVFL